MLVLSLLRRGLFVGYPHYHSAKSFLLQICSLCAKVHTANSFFYLLGFCLFYCILLRIIFLGKVMQYFDQVLPLVSANV